MKTEDINVSSKWKQDQSEIQQYGGSALPNDDDDGENWNESKGLPPDSDDAQWEPPWFPNYLNIANCTLLP